jgi:hypothetical protein
MRHILIFTAALIMINTAPRAQTLDAGPILAAARTALGGDKKLAAIKSFKAGGHLTRLIGNVQLAGDVELSCELPDRYVRKETLSFGSGSATTAIGFNGSGVIAETVNAPMADGGDGRSVRVFLGPGASQPGTTAEQKAEARGRALANAKQDFIRVTLGLFATSFNGAPVQFAAAGTAESADGKADVVDVRGEAGFQGRLFIGGKTHLPLMMSWQGPPPRVVIQTRRGREGGQLEPPSSSVPEPTVEYRLFFADYREVDGVRVPFRWSHTVAGKPVEELILEQFRTNPKISAKTFDVSK